MSGRFYAVPLFMAIILFVRGVPNPRFALVACALIAAYIAWSPVSAVKFGTSAYRPFAQNASRIDTKMFVLDEGAALLNWKPGKRMPDHPWYRAGESMRAEPRRVYVGGVGGEAIGYVGFAAGPGKHFIDRVGLGDPLLARLPADRPATIDRWKSGHFHRSIPAGYVDSITLSANLLRDPDLHAYYDVVRTLTRGPIFKPKRLRMILNMNLGRYDYLLAQTRQHASAAGGPRR